METPFPLRSDDTRPYRHWDILITAIVTLAAVEIPLQLVLLYQEPVVMVYVDGVVTLLFLADLLLRCRRFMVSHGKNLETSPTLIQQYVRPWLLVDLLATIPFRLLVGTTPLQLLRLVKLARVVQFLRQRRQSE